MKRLPWKTYWLGLSLAAARQGALFWLGLVLALAAALAGGVVTPWLRADNQQLRRDLVRAAARQPAVPASSPAERSSAMLAQRAADFTEVLGVADSFERDLDEFFLLAANNGLTLAEASYDYPSEPDAPFQEIAIGFPLTGSYPAILNFCEQSLLAMPFAALDSVQLKRDGADLDKVQATVHFTLYLARPARGAP